MKFIVGQIKLKFWTTPTGRHTHTEREIQAEAEAELMLVWGCWACFGGAVVET